MDRAVGPEESEQNRGGGEMNDEIRMMNDELPESWSRCEIGGISPVVGGGTPPSKDPTNFVMPPEGTPWITPADLSRYREIYISHGSRNLTTKGCANSAAKMLPKGALLFSSRAPVGYVAIASNPVCTNQGFKSFVLPQGFDSRFGYFYLRHIKPVAEAMATGTTFKELSGAAAARLPFVIAPLAEQKRIADKLEAVLGRVDACRARLDRVPALLKRFRQSVLAAATSGKLTEQWREETNTAEGDAKTLGQVIKVSSGKALTAKNMAADGSIPVFGGNGINGYHDEGNIIEETLVIGRVGYYCGCVHMTPQVAWVTDNALIVRHDATESSKRYLFYALQALDLRTNDAATAQPVISGQKIYSLLLTLPTLPEQQEIVRRVEDLFAFADRIEARLATAQKTVERLTPATLAKAFRGELVPQDPNDEPASVLLKRLRSSEPSAPAGRGRRKAAK